MSTQTQQPQTQQQPVVVYTNSVPGQAAPISHVHHSDGSFGTVFIVLAVIIVISGIACFLGRLCNRHMNQTKPSKEKPNHDFRPKQRDVELGFDGRIPTAAAKPGAAAGHGGDPSKGFKMLGNGDPRGFRSMHEHRDPTGIRLPGNGDPTTGFRMPGNGDPTGFRMAGPKPVDDGAVKPDA